MKNIIVMCVAAAISFAFFGRDKLQTAVFPVAYETTQAIALVQAN